MRSVIERYLVALAATAYLLPLSASLVTNVAHDAYHLREYLEHGVTELAAAEDAEAGDFVHAHGGAEHSHDAATDALLEASQRTDDPADEHHAATLELVGHLPGHEVVVGMVAFSAGAPTMTSSLALPTSPSPPPLPPPRA